jgi:type II secretory pathway pseudopilin PulG
LIEMLIVSTVVLVVTAAALPTITSALRQSAVREAADTVAMTTRQARYQAVTRNVRLRVRFNCPAAGQLRIVEVTGNPAIDDAADRCNDAVYPYPAPDANPATLPNSDGPVIRLSQGIAFSAAQDLEISTSGRITPLTGCPACVAAAPPANIALGDAYQERRMTIGRSGQIAVSDTVHAVQ